MPAGTIALLLVFLALAGGVCALEAWRRRRVGLGCPLPREVLSNLGCGALRAVVAVVTGGALAAVYQAVHGRFAVVELDAARASTWVVALVAYDFFYYWVHRLSHRVPLLWAGHAIHHEATDFNLTVLVRASAIAQLLVFPFYLPLAVLGVPTPVYLAVALAVHTVMFGLHTRLVGDLGAFGWLLNTPSHHRVHHSARSEDFDKNLGGVLIVWDRLFGTFRAETESVTAFGLSSRAPIACPIRANLTPFRELGRQVRAAAGCAVKLEVLLSNPGARPDQ
jgi:alkylglycerol monooxygenase